MIHSAEYWKDLYYEQQLEFTESNGRIGQERDRANERAELAEKELHAAREMHAKALSEATRQLEELRNMDLPRLYRAKTKECDELFAYAGQLAENLQILHDALVMAEPEGYARSPRAYIVRAMLGAQSQMGLSSNDQAGSAKAAGAPGAESTAAPTNTTLQKRDA